MFGSSSSEEEEPEIKPIATPKITLTKRKNHYKDTRKSYTVSIVVPSSIIDNAQSLELKTYLVSQIAKAAAVFQVDEIIVLSNDKA